MIFPITLSQANGIEDARFVVFDKMRAAHLLRDLHGLQRHGDPLRTYRNERLQVLSDDTAQGAAVATKEWGFFPARSTAATP